MWIICIIITVQCIQNTSLNVERPWTIIRSSIEDENPLQVVGWVATYSLRYDFDQQRILHIWLWLHFWGALFCVTSYKYK